MNQPPKYPSYEQRVFNLYGIKDNPGIEYLRHPNGVIVVRVGEDHECLAKDIQQVSFDTSNKKGGGKDRAKQVVVGKGKKGALKLMPDTKLCLIKCADGTVYTIRAGIKSSLIETNNRLTINPQLLKESRTYSGFICIVIPPAILNNQPNAIPPEFDVIIRIGTEIPTSSKLFAPLSKVRDDSKVNDSNNTAIKGNGEESSVEAKKLKLEGDAA